MSIGVGRAWQALSGARLTNIRSWTRRHHRQAGRCTEIAFFTPCDFARTSPTVAASRAYNATEKGLGRAVVAGRAQGSGGGVHTAEVASCTVNRRGNACRTVSTKSIAHCYLCRPLRAKVACRTDGLRVCIWAIVACCTRCFCRAAERAIVGRSTSCVFHRPCNTKIACSTDSLRVCVWAIVASSTRGLCSTALRAIVGKSTWCSS